MFLKNAGRLLDNINGSLSENIPDQYRGQYQTYCSERNLNRLHYLFIIMAVNQLLTLLLYLIIYPVTFGLPKVNDTMAFVVYSIFYFIILLLSSHVCKNMKNIIGENSGFIDTVMTGFLLLMLANDLINIALQNGTATSISHYFPSTLILALLPMISKKKTIGIIISYLFVVMAFISINTGMDNLVYYTAMVLDAMVAIVATIFSRNSNVGTYIDRKKMIDTNMQLAAANNQLEALNESLAELSTTDQLTNISNRRAFDDYMAKTWSECRRIRQPITVLMLDIDHFKAFNDYFGHVDGDMCLCNVASNIAQNFNRSSDMFARYGGEEFVAILPFTKGESIMTFVEKIRAGVEDMKQTNPASKSSPFITVSIGVASRIPDINHDSSHLVSLADAALYKAKQCGRNRIVADFNEEGGEEGLYVAPRSSAISVPGFGEDLEKLNLIIKATMITIFSINLSSGIVEFSRDMLAHFGETEDMDPFVHYTKFIDYVYSEDQALVMKNLEDIVAKVYNVNENITYRLRWGTDNYRWVSMTIRYVYGETLHQDQAIGSINDFSSQMRDQEINYLTATGSANYSYYYDFKTNKAYFNENFRKTFGIETEFVEKADSFFIKLINKSDRKIFINELKVLIAGETDSMECRLRLRSPKLPNDIWLMCRGKVSTDFNGKLQILAGSLTDITEQVKTEKKNDLIIEGSSDCIFVFDFESNVVEFSSKILEIVNFDSTIIHDAYNTWLNKILPEDRNAFISSMNLLLSGQTDIHKAEYRMEGVDGLPIWIAARAKCTFNDAGKPSILAGSLLNINSMWQFNHYLEKVSMADRLTGLPNRVTFYQDMSDYLTLGDNSGSIIMIDMDDFNNINSMFGLNKGDRFLTELGALFTLSMSINASLYHLGGDRFIVNYKGGTVEEAQEFANMLRETASNGLWVDDVDIKFTISVGIVEYEQGNTIDDIITNAEITLRKVKSLGKNKVGLFNPEDKAAYLARLELEAKLRDCVLDDFKGFEPFYQPFYSTSLHMIIGAEALLRWRDETGKIISPDVIIPCLQSIGLFHEVESWILQKGALQCGLWLKAGIHEDFIINVNLSPARATKVNLVDEVLGVIASAGISASNLFLEITEESLIMEMQNSIYMLRGLQRNGIRLAIDDFGTGYSSLGYLRDLPVCEIKIDKSFINDIETNLSSRKFVGSIIQLSHSMDYVVCVEGVETYEQMVILLELNADILQGYYFSPPVSAERFEEQFLVKSENWDDFTTNYEKIYKEIIPLDGVESQGEQQ